MNVGYCGRIMDDVAWINYGNNNNNNFTEHSKIIIIFLQRWGHGQPPLLHPAEHHDDQHYPPDENRDRRHRQNSRYGTSGTPTEIDTISVADLGCLSRILIFTHPGSRIPDPGSRISDPKTATKERGKIFFFVIPFYGATNFTKLKIILVFKCWRKKFGPIFKELQNFLPEKLSLSSQKYGFGIRDSGSEIRDPENTYSGSRIQGSKRHRIPDPDPQHWIL